MPRRKKRKVRKARSTGASTKPTTGKAKPRAAGSPGPGVGDHRSVVRHMQAYRAKLVSERDALTRQLEAIDRALATMGGASPAGRPRGKAAAGGRPGSLKDHITRVLESTGQPMRVAEITDSVLASGFQTKNQTLAKSVGVALTQMSNVKKVSRGVFGLK